MDEIAEMKETFLKEQQDLADRLVHLETTTREDPGKALQDRIAALEREVYVQKRVEVQQAVQVPVPTSPDSFEQAFKEVQQRDARKAQICISNLSFAEESTDTLQALTEDFFRTEMQVDTADSQVSAVKRFTGKDGRPGILIVSCRSVQWRNAILKGAKTLRGRAIYVNPNYTKMQPQEQFRLRQLRRSAGVTELLSKQARLS